MKIEGSSAIVVGGASGLGEATARRLHAQGAVVTVADVNAEKGAALASELGRRVRRLRRARGGPGAGGRGEGRGGRGRAAHRGVLRRDRLGAEGRRLQGPPPAAAVRDDHLDQPDRDVQRAALRRRGDDRQRAARGRRTRRVRQHRLDRGLRRPGRPDRLLRLEGRRGRDDAPGRARPRPVRDQGQHDRPRACSTRRCSPPCPRRPVRSSVRASPTPSAWASPTSTRSSPARSSRTACSTARRSGSTARCGCLPASPLRALSGPRPTVIERIG